MHWSVQLLFQSQIFSQKSSIIIIIIYRTKTRFLQQVNAKLFKKKMEIRMENVKLFKGNSFIYNVEEMIFTKNMVYLALVWLINHFLCLWQIRERPIWMRRGTSHQWESRDAHLLLDQMSFFLDLITSHTSSDHRSSFLSRSLFENVELSPHFPVSQQLSVFGSANINTEGNLRMLRSPPNPNQGERLFYTRVYLINMSGCLQEFA